MQLSHELPDYAFTLRSADGQHARVNDRTLTASFILSPQQLTEHWSVSDSSALTPEDLAPLIALQPEVILLGTGERQKLVHLADTLHKRVIGQDEAVAA